MNLESLSINEPQSYPPHCHRHGRRGCRRGIAIGAKVLMGYACFETQGASTCTVQACNTPATQHMGSNNTRMSKLGHSEGFNLPASPPHPPHCTCVRVLSLHHRTLLYKLKKKTPEVMWRRGLSPYSPIHKPQIPNPKPAGRRSQR